MCGWRRKPFVILYVNLSPIAHSPLGSLSNDLKAIKYTSPRVGWGGSKCCTKDVTRREISCLEDTGNHKAWVCENSPSLLRQHSKIESLQVSEAHTPP